MDPQNIPFNALIVGPTNSGKKKFFVNQLFGPFRSKFDNIMLICPTFALNRTLSRFAERDPRMKVIICERHQVENWLKVASFHFEGNNTLIVLDDCAASKDVKGRTGELVKLGFLARHSSISLWVLTQQFSSIAKPFRENVAAIVLFYTPSAKTTKAVFEEYAVKEKSIMAKPSTPYSRPVGVDEKKLPPNVKTRYLYQPGELEGVTKRGTDPVWSLKVYTLEKAVDKPGEPVLYYLHDGPRRGFVREELLIVPPNTQLPPAQAM